jgi:hypothetical protein
MSCLIFEKDRNPRYHIETRNINNKSIYNQEIQHSISSYEY